MLTEVVGALSRDMGVTEPPRETVEPRRETGAAEPPRETGAVEPPRETGAVEQSREGGGTEP